MYCIQIEEDKNEKCNLIDEDQETDLTLNY